MQMQVKQELVHSQPKTPVKDLINHIQKSLPTLVNVLRKRQILLGNDERVLWSCPWSATLATVPFGVSTLNASQDHAALTHLYYMQDTSTRQTIAFQGFDFSVEHKPGKLHVVPHTLSRFFGDTPEGTTQGKSLSDVLPSQPRLASICRNVPEDGQPQCSPSPRVYEVHSDNLNEINLVESDRELFASILLVFPKLDPEKLKGVQKSEFGPYFKVWMAPIILPFREEKHFNPRVTALQSMEFRSYLPGHLRQLSFRRSVSGSVGVTLAHNASMSWPSSVWWSLGIYSDVWQSSRPILVAHNARRYSILLLQSSCDACQCRKTPHRGPPFPTGHVPVDRPFQRVAIDLVEYKTVSQGCKYVLSVINHLIRFVIFDAIPNKEATTIARTLVDRVFFRIRSTRVVTFRHG